jgi:hypothetical protein
LNAQLLSLSTVGFTVLKMVHGKFRQVVWPRRFAEDYDRLLRIEEPGNDL